MRNVVSQLCILHSVASRKGQHFPGRVRPGQTAQLLGRKAERDADGVTCAARDGRIWAATPGA